MKQIIQPTQIDIITNALLADKIVIMPTDTIYGIHCLAQKPHSINRIYEIKKRNTNVPLITLISDAKDLELFNVNLNQFAKEKIKEFWPGPNTLIFDINHDQTQAFRLPKNKFLRDVLKATGPLISTSANLHGMPPANDINAAVETFGDEIDLYVDGGVLNNAPSSIYKICNNEITKIR